MNKKTIFTLLALFIVLAFFVAYPSIRKRISKGPDPALAAELNLTSITLESTDRFEIKTPQEDKQFSKDNGKWKVNGLDASPKEIDDFFGNIKKLKVESQASKNRDNHKSYGITEEEGALLSFTQGSATIAYIVGKSANFGDGFYMRKKDGDNVYVVSGATLSSEIFQTAYSWRDKTIIDVSKDDLQKIEIMTGQSTTTVSKTTEGKWQIQKNDQTTVLEDALVEKMHMLLNPLIASSFLSDVEIAEFNSVPGKTKIRIYSYDGGQLAELEALQKEDSWQVKVSGKDIVYTVAGTTFSDVFSSLMK